MLWSSAWADTPAFSSGGSSSTQPLSFAGTKGWAFLNNSVSGSGNYMAITQLGVFDYGGDGLANAHTIGIWSADGTLLASATIPAGTAAPLVNGYRYMPITPVLIPPGAFPTPNPFIALVAAAYLTGDADDMVTPLLGAYANPVYPSSYNSSSSHGFYGLGTGLPFPGSSNTVPEGGVGPALLEVNFQYSIIQVPEPATGLLLATGLLGLFLRQRHKRQRNKIAN